MRAGKMLLILIDFHFQSSVIFSLKPAICKLVFHTPFTLQAIAGVSSRKIGGIH